MSLGPNSERVAAIAKRLRAAGIDDVGEALLQAAATVAGQLDAGVEQGMAGLVKEYRALLADLAQIGTADADDDPDATLHGRVVGLPAPVRDAPQLRPAHARR